MNIQVLISTMNQSNVTKLVEDMRVKSAVVINQITQDIKAPKDIIDRRDLTLISVKDRGLSKSRNMAIENADSDICLIADDDMYYVDDYEVTVGKAYQQHPDADIIAFYVDHEDPAQSAKIQKRGRLNLLKTMKVVSYQISFRLSSIERTKLRMDETFGTGTDKYMGEENIFLFDAHRRGLVIHYVPIKIATLKKDNISTWFNGYNEKYFTVKGMVFKRMHPALTLPLILQFGLRKYPIYKDTIRPVSAFKFMIKGAYFDKYSTIKN